MFTVAQPILVYAYFDVELGRDQTSAPSWHMRPSQVGVKLPDARRTAVYLRVKQGEDPFAEQKTQHKCYSSQKP